MNDAAAREAQEGAEEDERHEKAIEAVLNALADVSDADLQARALELKIKLEDKKLDLLMLGATPRGVYLRDEAKKVLAVLAEVQRELLRRTRRP